MDTVLLEARGVLENIAPHLLEEMEAVQKAQFEPALPTTSASQGPDRCHQLLTRRPTASEGPQPPGPAYTTQFVFGVMHVLYGLGLPTKPGILPASTSAAWLILSDLTMNQNMLCCTFILMTACTIFLYHLLSGLQSSPDCLPQDNGPFGC